MFNVNATSRSPWQFRNLKNATGGGSQICEQEGGLPVPTTRPD